MGNMISKDVDDERETSVVIGWHMATPAIYCTLEAIAAYHFTPWYSYRANYISDLGIPYPHYNATQGQELAHSPKAWLMNLNFTLLSLGFGLSPLMLYRRAMRLHRDDDSDRSKSDNKDNDSSNAGQQHQQPQPLPPPRLSNLKRALLRYRLLCGLLYAVGAPLVGLVHGGPQEKASGAQMIHSIGAMLAIGPANLHMILTGITTLAEGGGGKATVGSKTTRRIAELEIVLGLVGLVSSCTFEMAPAGHVGTVERIAVYVGYLWMFIKGVELALERRGLKAGKAA